MTIKQKLTLIALSLFTSSSFAQVCQLINPDDFGVFCTSPGIVLETIERNSEVLVWQGPDDRENLDQLYTNDLTETHTFVKLSKDGSTACVLSFSVVEGEAI